jgi:hypothetical protein
MGMQYDVLSTACANGAATSVFEGPARVKGMTISYASGGTVVIANGTTNVYSFTAPAAAGSISVLIPGEGIRCSSNVVATTANATAVVFYG